MAHKEKAINLSFNLDYQTITLIKMKMFHVCFLYILLLYGGFFLQVTLALERHQSKDFVSSHLVKLLRITTNTLKTNPEISKQKQMHTHTKPLYYLSICRSLKL